MILPTIHIGGTSQRDLVEAMCDAKNAMDEAIEKIAKTSPNQRDYIWDNDAYKAAQKEHNDRIVIAKNLRDQLNNLATAISEIGD